MEEYSTPLHVAVSQGRLKEVEELLQENGQDIVNVTNERKQTPLHLACAKGHLPIVLLLIKYQADINVRDEQNDTPLNKAALNGHKDVVCTLINEFGCNPSVKGFRGRTLLHQACDGGHLELMEILISIFNNDPIACDNDGATPLHTAAFALAGQTEPANLLITKYKCPVDCRDTSNHTPLHYACIRGHLSVVRMLVTEHKADLNAHSNDNNTPLHEAALHGHKDVVSALINEFECSPSLKGFRGRTLLHQACAHVGGHLELMELLTLNFNNDPMACDNDGDTPLHIAARAGQTEAANLLITKYKCPVDCRNTDNNTPLHYACRKGHLSVVRMLVTEHKADLNAHSNNNDTPLHKAALNGRKGVVCALINEFNCSPSVKGFRGRTLLHHACNGGHLKLMEILISIFNNDPIACDNDGDTPLHIAALAGQTEAANLLITKYKCPVDCRDTSNYTPLHYACRKGHLSVVRMLVTEHKADLNARSNGNTPLHEAALHGRKDVVCALINEFNCSPSVKGFKGRTLLHYACNGGHLKLIEILISKFKNDPMAYDNYGDTPLHIAAFCGRTEAANLLITKYKCPVDCRDTNKKTPLHYACQKGHLQLVKTLILNFNAHYGLLLLADDHGNTPLHSCSLFKNSDCLEFLLQHSHAPIFIRNKGGKTAKDIGDEGIRIIFNRYLKSQHSVIQKEYKNFQTMSKQKYTGKQQITRLFVLGNPQAGKSTLVDSLKRESFFSWTASVTPHTSGIVPSIHVSENFGRVIFYDFAGDSEYYSSHAAILERVAVSTQGISLYFLVIDLSKQEKEIKEELGYWLLFVEFQSKNVSLKSKILIVASHYDKESQSSCQSKLQTIHEFTLKIERHCQGVIEILPIVPIDCRSRNSTQTKSLRSKIQELSMKAKPCGLSLESTILHGLLEKDFQKVTACKVQTLLTHIEETGIVLPKDVSQLYLILKQLHDVGLLMIIGRNEDKLENHLIILNPSELTNEVHKTLFSETDSSPVLQQYTTGIIPEAELQRILPEYITKECLIQLQYCQELSHIDIGLDPDHSFIINTDSEIPSSDSAYLYFPALCKQNKPKILPTGECYNIGWYAECVQEFDYYPPRFIHVLLLRLANTFALPSDEFSGPCKRRCNMWTNGLEWLTDDGVICSVEIVKANKGLVVFTSSSIAENEEKCTSVLSQIVCKVLETKAEYCHSVKPKLFLVGLQEQQCHENFDPENRSNLFLVKEVDKALKEGKKTVVSADDKGLRTLECQKLRYVGKYTYWGDLFQVAIDNILDYIKDIVREWSELGLALGLSTSCVRTIEADHSSSVMKCKQEMIWEWMTSSKTTPPCWWTLVKALQSIDNGVLAAKIEADYGLHISLQKKLLDADNSTVKPDEDFLQSFSEVVGARWPSIAALLSLTTPEIEEIRRNTQGSPSSQQALHMLRMWSGREMATYGLLCERLKKITIFGY